MPPSSVYGMIDHYIISGIALTVLEHENGSRKISSLHSASTVFPGSHRAVFKIEHSISTIALSDMEPCASQMNTFFR